MTIVHIRREDSCVTMEAEFGVTQLKDKEHQGLPVTTGSWKDP